MHSLLYTFIPYRAHSLGFSSGLITLFIIIMLWDLIWKVVALWKAGKNNQLVWFICILIFNTCGILPLVYLIWFQKTEKKKKK